MTEEVKSFKDFGAVGDGKTDDAVALQAAFDWSRRTGGKLEPSPGTFMVSAPIEMEPEGEG